MRSSFILIIIVILGITGCSFDKTVSVIEKKEIKTQYQVVDDKGNILDFTDTPRKIYATTLSLEEILTDLVPLERIAAISEPAADPKISLIADKAAQISLKLPQKVSAEQILAIKPDLVIVQENSNTAFIKTLKDSGLKVYITKVPTTLNMVRQRIINLSVAVNEKQQGNRIIDELDHKTKFVKDVIGTMSAEEKKILMGYSLLGVFGSAEGLFNDICINAGVTNGAALAGLVRGEHLSKEKILEVDPDVLMFSDYSSTQEGDTVLFRKEVLSDPALQSIKAIKNNNIIIIKDRYRYAASQYIGDGILDIAKKTYPEYFKKNKK
ncbi:ABC transporter substrate-binding protein [Phascolarctobacterium faecium]|uniref:ABC transporter substrate-binding protein n=1 Tax=Phascolarctobacterium faecium TaxID=33025 RepID=UPI003FED657E